MGFDEEHVVAALPAVRVGTRWSPTSIGPSPTAAARSAACASGSAPRRRSIAAFGDNAFDVALLASARVPVAVRPKPRLRERAAEVRGSSSWLSRS